MMMLWLEVKLDVAMKKQSVSTQCKGPGDIRAGGQVVSDKGIDYWGRGSSSSSRL